MQLIDQNNECYRPEKWKSSNKKVQVIGQEMHVIDQKYKSYWPKNASHRPEKSMSSTRNMKVIAQKNTNHWPKNACYRSEIWKPSAKMKINHQKNASHRLEKLMSSTRKIKVIEQKYKSSTKKCMSSTKNRKVIDQTYESYRAKKFKQIPKNESQRPEKLKLSNKKSSHRKMQIINQRECKSSIKKYKSSTKIIKAVDKKCKIYDYIEKFFLLIWRKQLSSTPRP